MRRCWIARLVLVFSCISGFLAIPDADAQLPANSSTTAAPVEGAGHNYLGQLSETVNPATGSVSIRIPVAIPPSRGITLPFFIAYDSTGRYMSNNGLNPFWRAIGAVNSSGGWSNTVPVVTDSYIDWHTQEEPGLLKRTCSALLNFVFQDAGGNRHGLRLTNYKHDSAGLCDNTSDWPPSFDGEVVLNSKEGPIEASIPSTYNPFTAVTVTDGNGTAFYFSQTNQETGAIASSVSDRNGNFITITAGSGGAFTYTDTVGRTVLQNSAFGVSPEMVTVSGLGAPYTLNWTSQSGPSFATPVTTPVWSGSVACSVPNWNGSGGGLSSITLPNGRSYRFTYDPTYGVVNKITYPLGGYVRYVWGWNMQAEYAQYSVPLQTCSMYYGVPAVVDRYVSFDGTTEVLRQHFAYSTTWPSSPPQGNVYWISKQTTVTTYDLVRNNSFQTVYTYSSIGSDYVPNTLGAPTAQIPVESSVSYYGTDGSPLKTVTKKWTNVSLLKGERTSFPNGQAFETRWTYNTDAMEIERDDYDFGTTPPPDPAGPLLRRTVTNYASFGATHIVDKPSSVIVYDGAGTPAAETDYGYDETAPTPVGNVVQHVAGYNFGNLTSKSVWVNGTGTKFTTTYTYDDTGQMLTMTDPRLNTTTYSYADSFTSGGPTGGAANAYVTTVTNPPTNGVSHIEHFSYAYTSGKVRTATDENNLVTTYEYADNFRRLTQTNFPDNGQTTIAYDDSPYSRYASSPSITTTKRIDASTNLVTITAMDGLGQVVRTLLSSDPRGTVYIETAYDGLGRVLSVSNPYRTGSPVTTTFNYDALGRKISETAPDGSVTTTAYCAGYTLVTDPTSRWRRSRMDGLGRLVEVDEPNAVGAMVVSNGCPGGGDPIWVTNYTVNTLGNLKQVVQYGSHQREFNYDFLSRLTSASNPESGTVTYNYDSDGNCSGANSFPGLLVSKIDARGVRTCFQYDALNRLVQKNYSDGATAAVRYAYDGTTLSGCTTPLPALTDSNPKGYRTAMCDGSGATSWAHDPMGRISSEKRTIAFDGSTVTKAMSWDYNFDGQVSKITYPHVDTNTNPYAVTYSYDSAGRPILAAHLDLDSSKSEYFVSGVEYAPQGAISSIRYGSVSGGFQGIAGAFSYNARLQPLQMVHTTGTLPSEGELNQTACPGTQGDIQHLVYGFGLSANNNGNVQQITNCRMPTESQAFTYDALNRLAAAQAGGGNTWSQTFGYDAWANLKTIAAVNSPGLSADVNTKNQLTSSYGQYDAAGNMTAYYDGFSWKYFIFDAENRLKQTVGGPEYAYDGDGKRVRKPGKLYWTGFGTDALLETDDSGVPLAYYIFFNGKRIATKDASATDNGK